jgi:transposase
VGYSTDLREKVLAFIEAGGSVKSACTLFVVSRSSVQRWRLIKNETGTLSRKPRPKSSYKVDENALKNYIANHPDAFLNEIAEYFNITTSGICRALHRLKITRKKKLHFTQKEMKKSENNL